MNKRKWLHIWLETTSLHTDEQVFQRAGLQYKSLSTQLLVDGVAKHLINHADENTKRSSSYPLSKVSQGFGSCYLRFKWYAFGKFRKNIAPKDFGKKCIPISLKRLQRTV